MYEKEMMGENLENLRGKGDDGQQLTPLGFGEALDYFGEEAAAQ